MFDNGVVKVNDKFFSVPGTQFPIKNIGAIQTATFNNKFWTLGKILFTVIFAPMVIGLIVPAWYYISTNFLGHHYGDYYVVSVTSAGASSEAYRTSSLHEANQIVQAVNEAIAKVA